jgi:hypothetical protein
MSSTKRTTGRWSEEDIDFLTQNYPYKQTKELVDTLNRKVGAIHAKAKSLGLEKRNKIAKKRLVELGYIQKNCDIRRNPLYCVWKSMKGRCYNENDTRFYSYGAKGVIVSEEWRYFDDFYIWSIENGYKEGLSIDRINNDGNYSPENCRWATNKQQSRNRSDNLFIKAFSENKCLQDWSEDSRCKVSRSLLSKRIYGGMDAETAISTPAQKTIIAFGETKTLKEWVKDDRCSVSYNCLHNRISKGWDSEKAISKKSGRWV